MTAWALEHNETPELENFHFRGDRFCSSPDLEWGRKLASIVPSYDTGSSRGRCEPPFQATTDEHSGISRFRRTERGQLRLIEVGVR